MGAIRIAIISVLFFASTSTTYARSAAAPPKASVVAGNKSVSATRGGEQSEHPKWLEICNTLAPATSVLCSLAPLPTIFEISRNKDCGSMPLLPYSSMAANGFIWALYGILTDSPAVKWANILGTLLGSYYFKEFRKYSPAGASGLPGTVKQHIFVVTCIIFANTFTLANFPKKTASEIVGKEGVLMYIILFASPLAAVQNVIATKSAASIPLPFTVASTINCSLWSVVGLLLMKDFYIYFPSMMGLACALAQLFLKGIYGDSNVGTAAFQEMSSSV
ncbi:hypothetical protein ACHAXR_003293 [Thalassiosira sp. AJA248-18]